MNDNWQETTIDILSRRIGPTANIIVEDIHNNLNPDNRSISDIEYTDFLLSLACILPHPENS